MGVEEKLDNPTLSEAMQVAVDAVMTQLRVALPGCVATYDSKTRKATVVPLLMRRMTSDAVDPTPLSSIPNVPIVFPQTTKGALILPIAKGDPVTILFSDRALDAWKAGNGVTPVEPNNTRKHHLSDCWAMPGGYPDGFPFTAHSEGNLEIQVAPGTKVYIGKGVEELISLLSEVLDFITTTITFSNAGGPTGPPTNASVLTAIKDRLDSELKV